MDTDEIAPDAFRRATVAANQKLPGSQRQLCLQTQDQPIAQLAERLLEIANRPREIPGELVAAGCCERPGSDEDMLERAFNDGATYTLRSCLAILERNARKHGDRAATAKTSEYLKMLLLEAEARGELPKIDTRSAD